MAGVLYFLKLFVWMLLSFALGMDEVRNNNNKGKKVRL
jgi:hypothetical protein